MLRGHRPGSGERDRHLERGEYLASVSAGPVEQVRDRVLVGGGSFGLEPAAHERLDRSAVERLEPEERGPAAQGWIDLEERVLGGGADQGQRPVLDRREQGVLLRLRETMDLVQEEDRAPPVLPEPVTGTLDHLTHVFHAGGYGREPLERPLGGECDDLGQGRLARSGRTPEDRRRQPVLLDEASHRSSGTNEVLLPDDLVEGSGTKARRQRGLGPQALRGCCTEKIVTHAALDGTRGDGTRPRGRRAKPDRPSPRRRTPARPGSGRHRPSGPGT